MVEHLLWECQNHFRNDFLDHLKDGTMTTMDGGAIFVNQDLSSHIAISNSSKSEDQLREHPAQPWFVAEASSCSQSSFPDATTSRILSTRFELQAPWWKHRKSGWQVQPSLSKKNQLGFCKMVAISSTFSSMNSFKCSFDKSALPSSNSRYQ